MTYHCVDCYFAELFTAFKAGDPDAFEDGEIEDHDDEEEEQPR